MTKKKDKETVEMEKAFKESEKIAKEEAVVALPPVKEFLAHLRERMQRTHVWTEQDEDIYNKLQG